jgi:tetratricopeptide (TPR) repeat protein
MVVALLGACAGPAPAERDGVGQQLLEQAEQLERQGDYEAAVAKYREFIAGDFYISRDGEYYSSYDAEDAIGAIYITWAEELQGQGQFDQAIEKYQAFIDGGFLISRDGDFYSSSDAEDAIGAIYITWAEELQEQGEYDQAIEKYQTFVDGGFLISRDGDVYGSGDAEGAIGAIYITWAEELQRQGEYDQAIEKYQAFLDMDTWCYKDGEYYGSYDAEKALGALYITWAGELEGQGKYCQAIENYQAFIDGSFLISEDGEYYGRYDAEKALERCCYPCGRELQDRGDYEAAIEKFAEVSSSSDDYQQAQEAIPDCYYSWAMQLKNQGQYHEAIEKYISILERYPKWASEEKGDALLQDMSASYLLQSFMQILDEWRWEGAVWLCQAISNVYSASPEATQAQQALEEAVDAYVTEVASSEYAELPEFTVISELAGGLATIEIRNACPYILTVFFSGPESKAISIMPHPDAHTYLFPPIFDPSPWQAGTIQMEPGEYQLAAKVSDPSIAPYYGTVSFASDEKNTCYFYILETWGF